MIQLYLVEIPLLVQAMKKSIADRNWEKLKIATHSLIPTFSTVGINPEFEDIAKAIQAIAVNLISYAPGQEVSDETLEILASLYLKIETVCGQASEELEKEVLVLSVPQNA
jgi:hypothetical protein